VWFEMQCPAKIIAIVDDYVKISYAYLCKFFVSRDLNVRDMVFNMYHCLNWTIADQNENWKSFYFFSFTCICTEISRSLFSIKNDLKRSKV
jgi:hypothetical protein